MTILTGIISSIIATLVVFGMQYLKTKCESERLYNQFEGIYKCYSYISEDDTDSPQYYETRDNLSRAEIKRSRMKEFTITMRQSNQRAWSGTIVMQSTYFGHLAWKYDDDKRISGTKEVSFWKHNGSKVIYFRETFDRKYGRELLIKDSENNLNPYFNY